MTARDLITHAMQEIGALATSEALSDADAQASLVRMNSLLDAWQTERLTIYNLNRAVYTLVANQATYTIGPAVGADWACTIRPAYIQHVGVIYTLSDPASEIPVKIISDDEYAALRIKDTTSTLPRYLYYNPTFPSGTVFLWPVPTDTTVQVALYIPIPMTAGLTLDTVLSLAPSYEEALRYNLAIRLAPIFGRTLEPVTAQLAIESKATMKRSNPRTDEMRVDPAMLGGGAWDLWTGGQ